jgi:hypothetical protein
VALPAFPAWPHPLDRIADAASAAGYDEGRDLREVMSAAWTTSSEMIGEIGIVLLRLQRRTTDTMLRADVEAALREVRKVWPNLK